MASPDEATSGANGDGGKGSGSGDGKAELSGVTDPRDTDVLCGRGGAALRHPGNQTYRRLVNLNKGLYITCLKTEKLKISRSIVAAIREQQGRFLEKNTKKGTWFDIGDKKAIEKTSQALREGQPKLRQKMVEMGGLPPPNGGLTLDAQYAAAVASNNGIYTTQGMQQQQQQQRMSGFDASAAAYMTPHPALTQQQQQAHMAQQQHLAAQQSNVRTSSFQDMPPPRSRTASSNTHMMANSSLNSLASMNSSIGAGGLSAEMQADLLRMSLTSMNTAATAAAAAAAAAFDNESTRSSMKSRMRPSLTGRMAQAAHDLGIAESNLSLWSNFSGISAADINRSMGAMSIEDSGPGSGGDPFTFPGMGGGGGPSSSSSMGYGGIGMGMQQQSNNSNHLGGNNQNNNYNGNMGSNNNGNGNGNQQYNQQIPPPPPPPSSSMASPSMNSLASSGMPSPGMRHFDRRRLFAKMKYKRPPSQRSIGDGMPEIHPVDSSTFSLMSNLSAHNGTTQGAINMSAGYDANNNNNNNGGGSDGNQQNNNSNSNHQNNNNNFASNNSGRDGNSSRSRDPPGSNNNNPIGVAYFGSRRSLMSGLSRISDKSDEAGSIFSDLSRKIGNVSTRSIAVSEISGIEEEEGGLDDLDGFNLDPLAAAKPFGMGSVGNGTSHSVRMTDPLTAGSTHTATMEFADL